MLRRLAAHTWFAPVVLLAYCGALFLYGLNAGELYRTETLRAVIAAEFLRSGNWVVPTLYGEPLLTKPPGMYAAIALVSWPFGGVTDWSARLPSALAATSAVFLFCWYFRRQLGQAAGLVSAAVLPASAMWLDKASAAEIDMMQTAWVTAAVLFLLRALEDEESQGPRLQPVGCRWWLAALLCVAGGVLTKWTAPAFFYGTAVPLLWWRGRLGLLWGRNHLVSATVGASVCLAWAAAAVALAGWEPFYETVSREALQRLSPAHYHEAARHLQPGHEPWLYPWAEVLFHPVKVLAINLPWSAFALLTLRRGFSDQWDERGRFLLQALHCWTWPNLLFWSIIPEHASRLHGVLLAMLVAWLLVKVVFVEVVIPSRNPERAPRAKGQQIAAAVPDGQTLYLFHLKDEGIIFYYGRDVRRLDGPAELPSSSVPLYCILDESEWRQWQAARPAEAVLHLHDQQGAPIVLVKVNPGKG